MLSIDQIPPLVAGETAIARIHLAPSAEGEASVCVRAHPGLRLGRVRALLADGTPLALVEGRGDDELQLALGHLDGEALLELGLEAAVPLAGDAGHLLVRDHEENVVRVAVALVGGPAFGSRSKLSLAKPEAVPGDALVLTVALTNDGTADAQDACVRLALGDGFTFEAGSTAWREVNRDGHRSLVIPFGTIGVAQRVVRRPRVVLAPILTDGTAIPLVATAEADGQSFPLAPATLVVRSRAAARVAVRVVEPGPFHYGDRFTAVVTARADGSDVLAAFAVRLNAAGVRWNDGGESAEIAFDRLMPFAEESRTVAGRLVDPPDHESDVPLSLEPLDGADLTTSGTTVTVLGSARVSGHLSCDPLDAERAHRVRVVIRNDGDGIARTVRLRAVAADGVLDVADSLAVDGARRFTLDGRVAVTGEGVELGPLGIAALREVSWLVRSVVDQQITFRASVEVDGTTLTVAGDLALTCGVRPDELLAPDPVPVPPAPPTTAGAPDVIPEGLQPAPAEADSPDNLIPAPLDVGYASNPRALERWQQWFAAGFTDTTPVGVHLLAIREFLPVSASTAAAEAALAGIRSESEAVVAARLESYSESGIFAASGFDFGTPRLRRAMSALLEAAGIEGDASGVGLDRAMVRLVGVEDRLRAVFEPYRAALLDVLGMISSLEDYARPATGLALPAALLLDALTDRVLA